jgi:repressor LexA
VLVSKSPGRPVPQAAELPLLGKIAAGHPIEAVLDNETITLPEDMVHGKKAFALQVKGASMIDENISDGDYIIVEQTETANNGDMVVALVDGDTATLKRLYRERDHIRLEPANPEAETIVVRNRPIKIQGIVIGLLRRYV